MITRFPSWVTLGLLITIAMLAAGVVACSKSESPATPPSAKTPSETGPVDAKRSRDKSHDSTPVLQSSSPPDSDEAESTVEKSPAEPTQAGKTQAGEAQTDKTIPAATTASTTQNPTSQATAVDQPPTEDQPDAKPQPTYTDQQLNKNGTILVLAYQPDIRADFLIMTVRSFLDDEQTKQARALALSYDWRYDEIRKQRAALLETATDENKTEVDAKLRELRIQIFELNQKIRTEINRKILTPEQREQLKQRYQKKGVRTLFWKTEPKKES